MKLRSVVLVFGAVMMTGCAGKIVVTRVPSDAPPAMEGVYYALPKTVVKVDQPIDRISQQAGKYVVYLPIFFPRIEESGAYVNASSVAFKLNKASVSTYGEPDPEQIFYLKITGNGPIDRAGLFEYTEQGTASGVSAQADNATSDIVLSVLGTAVGLASKSFGAVLAAENKPSKESCVKAGDQSIPCKIVAFQTKPIDADALLASYSRLSTYQKEIVDKAAKENNPAFDDALSAYADIYTMQNDRANIRKSPGSFSADAALKDFDAAIASDLAYNFIGTEKKDTWMYSTDIRDYTLTAPVSLMKVHKSEGLCFLAPLPSGDRPPKPFWFDSASYLCDEKTISAALETQLKGTKEPDARTSLEKKLKELHTTLGAARLVTANFALNPATGQEFEKLRTAAQAGERGFYYRIPATADLVLKLGDDPVTQSKQSIAQFGTIASLPASTGGKSTAYTLKFYEATGALKSFNVTSKAIFQKSTADALGAQATTLADAKRTSEDELTKLDRQSKIMAAKKAIYDNCKALNIACGGFTPAQTALPQ